jgi:type II secretory pathway predicted ATPase ExeA
MEFKVAVLVGSLASVATYFWTIRLRMLPKTVKRLRIGYTTPMHTQQAAFNHTMAKSKESLRILRLVEHNYLDNKYYILCGKKGVGKTTLIEHVMFELSKKQGILYVKAEQTPNLQIFNQALCRAVNLNLTQKKLVTGSILTNIWRPDASTAATTELDDLLLILNHLEEALDIFQAQRNRKKPTLIIDHITYLADNNPKALKALQSKAKYWADHNLITVIFVGTDGRAPDLLEENSDKVRMNFVEIQGPSGEEAAEYILGEIEKLQQGYFKDRDEFMRVAGNNLLDYYNAQLKGKGKPAVTELTPEVTKAVAEYVIRNYMGGGYLDLMKFIEQVREGLTIPEIEE